MGSVSTLNGEVGVTLLWDAIESCPGERGVSVRKEGPYLLKLTYYMAGTMTVIWVSRFSH